MSAHVRGKKPAVQLGNKPRKAPGSSQPTSGQSTPTSVASTTTQTNGGSQSPSAMEIHARLVFLVTALLGSTIQVRTKAGQVFQGILTSAATEHELSLALASARLVTAAGTLSQEAKPVLLLLAKDIASFTAEAIDAHAQVTPAVQGERGPSTKTDSFRTDVEITGSPFDPMQGRSLQKWSDEVEEASPAVATLSGPTKGWNQFETNERLFGAKTDYNEELYTTKLDRSGKDFREREKRAERLAQEILTGTSANPHITEERNQALPNADHLDEEDKYSGVQRGPNAYVPPSARKSSGPVAATAPASLPSKPVNGAGIPVTLPARPAAPVVRPQQAAAASATDDAKAAASAVAVPPTATPANVARDFKTFVVEEKKRLQNKKTQAAAKVKDDQLAEFKRFAQSFSLKVPVPKDLVPLLAKDERKQQELLNGTTVPKPAASTANTPQMTEAKLALRSTTPTPVKKPVIKRAGVLPEIPSFAEIQAAKDRKAQQAGSVAKVENWVKAQGQGEAVESLPSAPAANAAIRAAQVKSPSPAPSSTSKINANAKEFIPNPKALAFTPGMGGSPARRPAELPNGEARTSPHPFFGSKVINRGEINLRVKEDFTPFAVTAHADVTSVSPNWPFTGRPYRQTYGQVYPPQSEEMNARSPSSGPATGAPPASTLPMQVQPMPMPPHMMQPGNPYVYYPPMAYRYPGQPIGQYQGPMPPQGFVPPIAFSPGQPPMYNHQVQGYYNPAGSPHMPRDPTQGGQYRKMSMTPQVPLPGMFPPQGPPPTLSPGPPA